MLVGAHSPTVQKCVWTKYISAGKIQILAIITYFMKIELPRAAIYRVCQCIETRKTAERKAESGRRTVQMPEKKRNQLVKTIWDKKGVTSMKLAEKMNADRSFVDRIVREAAVKT